MQNFSPNYGWRFRNQQWNQFLWSSGVSEQNQAELLVRTFLYTVSQPSCRGVIDGMRLSSNCDCTFRAATSFFCLFFYLFIYLFFYDDSGVLHSPGGWKLESVASLHVDNEVIFIINVHFCCESRAQSIWQRHLAAGMKTTCKVCGRSLNPRTAEKSAVNTAIADSWGDFLI